MCETRALAVFMGWGRADGGRGRTSACRMVKLDGCDFVILANWRNAFRREEFQIEHIQPYALYYLIARIYFEYKRFDEQFKYENTWIKQYDVL